MFLGKVVGSVWATQKEMGMEHLKLLLVQPIHADGTDAGTQVICADRIGAGQGETVIVSRGSSARILISKDSPVDAVVVGIVDCFEYCKE
ncbi:EutN/CcmL family microcompartment protein [Caldibacillus thermoamylovorans]